MSRSSDPLDPLPGHSILSLFPRTIEASTSGSNNGELNNLESIHDIMKSAGLRGADNLLEKAKAIVDGGSEFLYSKFSSFVVSVGNDETNSAKDKEKAQERRPGLGLKRARFSFKGNGSQPASSLLRPLDIDQLRDPEEFFLAYERRENAKKEIERLNGGSLTVLNENSPPRKERHRRPGILGNKSKPVRYKHRYPSVPSQNEPYAFSQEKLEESVYNSADHDMKIQTTVPIVEIEETEIAESTALSEDKVNETLDMLLSSKSGDLDEDVTLSLLQRHLQIKSFDPNEYCILDFCEIKSIDFVNPGGKLSKPQNALSNLHDFLKGTSSKTPSKHNEAVEKPIYLLASSASPKSPLGASMSLLRKRSFQSISSQDPFSSDNIDVTQVKSPGEQIDKHLDQCDLEKLGLFGKLKSSVGDEITKSKDANMCSKEAIDSFSSVNVDLSPVTRPVEQIGKQFGQFDLEKELHASGKLKSTADQIKKTTASNPGLKDLRVGDSDHLLSKSVTDYSRQEGVGPNVRPTEMCNDVMYERNVGEEVEDMSQQGEYSGQPDNCIEHSTRTYTDSDTQMYDNTERGENVEGLQQKAVSSEQVDISVEELATKNMSGRQHLLVQSNISPIEDHISDVPYKASEIGPKQKIKKCPNKLSLREDKEKKPSRKGKQGKILSHRQSLADAGTSWESGLRRSSRNRMRPLEYWKGERFLYGRVHGSLTTVIGVKYMSPAKDDGEPTFKVKSYVSNEYKELLDLAALH